MSATALRKCNQHSLVKTLRCLQYPHSIKTYIHSKHRSSSPNLRRRNRADKRTIELRLVLCQTQERRKDSQHSRACSARAMLLQSCKESLRCPEKRRKRRRPRDTQVNLFCSLHPPSNGRLRTRTSSALSSLAYIPTRHILRLVMFRNLWTLDSCLHTAGNHMARRACHRHRACRSILHSSRCIHRGNKYTLHSSQDLLHYRMRALHTSERSKWPKNTEQDKQLDNRHNLCTRLLTL